MGMAMKIRFTDVIRQGSLKNSFVNGKKIGYSFDIRLGYYRGQFLSCIDTLEVKVDGQDIAANNITFCLKDKAFSVHQLAFATTEFWGLLDTVTISVHQPGGLSAGEHDIDLNLMLRVPYLPLPGGDSDHHYMPLDSCDCKTLIVCE